MSTEMPFEMADKAISAMEEVLERLQWIQTTCRAWLNTDAAVYSLEESRKSIEQADKINQLNVLAFFFIPLSLLTSIFGMNVTQLGSPGPSIWVFFAAAVPLSAVVALSLWTSRNRQRVKNALAASQAQVQSKPI